MARFKRKIILITLLCATIVASLFILKSIQKEEEEFNAIEDNIVENTNTITDNKILFTKEDWQANKNMNNDYIGQIIFESEIIHEPVVQGDSNNTYLRKRWDDFKYDIQGTCFLDYRNSVDDQNLIIYGHYTDEKADAERPMFSNLDLLLDKENYEKNQYVRLYLENKVNIYIVASVYYCPLYKGENGEYIYAKEGYDYYSTSYTDEEFDNYMNTISNTIRYDTGVNVSNDDRFLTLQTCVSNRDDLREVVVCKLIETVDY